MDKIKELYLSSENDGEKSNIISERKETSILKLKDPPKSNFRLNEIPERRTKNGKIYRMSDGSEQAVIYSSNIHRLNEESGIYENVDTTLTLDENAHHYYNWNGKCMTKFCCDDNSKEIFSVEKDHCRITVYAEKIHSSYIKNIKSNLKKSSSSKFDTLVFNNEENGVDLEYSITSHGIKENILINDKSNEYEYSFMLHCENVCILSDETNKRITFLDEKTGTEVFFIPAPFMKDINGVVSTDVFYKVEHVTKDDILFTITANSEWINAKSRALPVTIDPQIMFSNNSKIKTYSWSNGVIYEDSEHTIGTVKNINNYSASLFSSSIATLNCDDNECCDENIYCDNDYYCPEEGNNSNCDNNCNENCDESCSGNCDGNCSSNTIQTAISISTDTWYGGSICNNGDEIWYQFVPNSTGSYTIQSSGSLDTIGAIYDQNGNLIACNDDYSGYNFGIITNLENGKTYYICVKAYGSNTGDYNVIVSPNSDNDDNNTGDFDNSSNTMQTAIWLPIDTWYNGCICCSGDETWYKFIANTTGEFSIRTSGSLDTMGYLYDSDGNQICYNDDSSDLNFGIICNLVYGKTYYLKVKAYSSNTGNYNIIVSPCECCDDCNCDSTYPDECTFNRMYVDINMPSLPLNPRIKKAEITLFQKSGACESAYSPRIGLYSVTNNITTGTCTPSHSNTQLLDFEKIKTGRYENGEIISYTFDITKIVDELNNSQTNSIKLVIKMIDEIVDNENYIKIFGANSAEYAPQISITYESSYGVNTSYRTHIHEIGRFGQGSVDLANGNLMFESEDFAWGGNRMPVTIKHLYNSALSGYQYSSNSSINLNTAYFGAMKIGVGFKLNIMQSMMPAPYSYDYASEPGYIYTNENGEEIYFKESTTERCNDDCTCCYKLYEDTNSGNMVYDPFTRILESGDETYLFDTSGRLISITDKYNNKMLITYSSGRIISITDGAGRSFEFEYDTNNFLTKVIAPDNSEISYSYENSCLSCIEYPDGKKAIITWSSKKPSSVIIRDANCNDVYKVAYTFINNKIHRVSEYGVNGNENFVLGTYSTYNYSIASHSTKVSTTELADYAENEYEDNVINTVYCFDNDGNIVSENVYTEDTGNTGAEGTGSGINPISNNVGIVNNTNNLLKGHNFHATGYWSDIPCNSSTFVKRKISDERLSKYGNTLLEMKTDDKNCTENGVYQTTSVLPKGLYAFSAYIRVTSSFVGTTNSGAYIRVTDMNGNVLSVSEIISKYDNDYIRVVAPFELSSSRKVNAEILVNGKGRVYVSSAQLENNPYANAYNMLEDGNFELKGTTAVWSKTAGVEYTTESSFNMTTSLRMTGDLDSDRYASQTIFVKSSDSTRETYTLSGWAKGYGIVNRERFDCDEAQFRIRAIIRYKDGEEYDEKYSADFSPCTEEWQFTSIQFTKEKFREIKCIFIYCEYNNNFGTAYFDDIQLTRNSIETGLSAEDFVTTDYSKTDNSKSTNSVTTESTTDSIDFEELIDAYGNTITETTYTDGEFGTIYRSFGYTNRGYGDKYSGNDLICETDSRGNETNYTVDEDTSRIEEIIDRCQNKTLYEYDKAGKTTRVINKASSGAKLAEISYKYDGFDNITEITRGDGMKYVLAYNEYHNLESIGIHGKSDDLVNYTYKTGNGRLKEIAYANGDRMKAAYNSIGQMISEKWYNKWNVLTAYYKYVYDGQGNIVRSIDMFAKKEYNYIYEGNKIVRATESDITVDSNEIIISKRLVNSIVYAYDLEDRLTKKRIIPVNGKEITTYYEYTDNGNTIAKFSVGGTKITSHSKTDSFGRKEFDELQLSKGFVSRKFSYHAGEPTLEHKNNSKLKSSPTTQLVSEIVMSDGRTLSYEYDNEERITKVIDSVEGTTEYVYDALGQLCEEIKNNVVVNRMSYDNYGNIISKNGIQYCYDDVWKDKLTCYDGCGIEYDSQGNPTYYRDNTLTWEKGRQLKSFNNITYTYNANGIRTSKTIGSTTHTYTLDGTKILRETWNGHTLVPIYDNEDNVCGIIYNNVAYYFLKNLQGDVISIVNDSGDEVATYSYDAWGVCTITKDFIGVGFANPFRYRGYYYDYETGLYYVSSRYYDPEIGRFLNADEATYLGASGTILGYNLFAYCENNPVNYEDPTGNWLIQVVCGVAGAAVFGTVANIVCRLLGVNATTRRLITAGFALIGGVLGAAFGPVLVGKIAPKALAWVNNLEKIINRKSRLRPMLFEGHVAIGWEWDRRFKIMLHFKHKNEPEKGMHIAIQHFTGRNWRRTIPDIPIKSLGKVFINWVKKFLK